MDARWVIAVVGAVVVCGPGPSGQELPSEMARQRAAALVPGDDWSPGRGWATTTALPPLKSEGKPAIEFILPEPQAQWTEGTEQTILWHWTGPVTKVRLYYEYGKCKLGGHERGRSGALVTQVIPNRGHATWTVPWMDAPGFWVRLAGFDDQDNRLVACERFVQLRPKEVRDLRGTFIVILRDRQRLYYFQDDRLLRMHLISTGRGGYATPRMQPGIKGWGVTMGKVFNKMTYAWSRAYNCSMPYWMAVTSSGMIGIHATTPSAYHRLGGVASHGCIRQHGNDARELYKLVKLGTPAYIF